MNRMEIFKTMKASLRNFLFDRKELNMKNPEKNAVAKIGYIVTMIVVTSAILICMKKYKDK